MGLMRTNAGPCGAVMSQDTGLFAAEACPLTETLFGCSPRRRALYKGVAVNYTASINFTPPDKITVLWAERAEPGRGLYRQQETGTLRIKNVTADVRSCFGGPVWRFVCCPPVPAVFRQSVYKHRVTGSGNTSAELVFAKFQTTLRAGGDLSAPAHTI